MTCTGWERMSPRNVYAKCAPVCFNTTGGPCFSSLNRLKKFAVRASVEAFGGVCISITGTVSGPWPRHCSSKCNTSSLIPSDLNYTSSSVAMHMQRRQHGLMIDRCAAARTCIQSSKLPVNQLHHASFHIKLHAHASAAWPCAPCCRHANWQMSK